MPENQASTPALLVALTRGDGPLQRQVEDQLRAAVRSGRLVAGERLPASRTLAADLGVSRGVVSDAYMQLAAEGYLLVAPRTSPIVARCPRTYALPASSAPSAAYCDTTGGQIRIVSCAFPTASNRWAGTSIAPMRQLANPYDFESE